MGKLSNKRQALQEKVKEYAAKRVELFKQELAARGLTWCTYCGEISLETETGLLFIEGREKYSHGYGNAFYGFRDISKLHRVCTKCRERAMAKHGQIGKFDSFTKDQESYHAFSAEKRADGYYACKFGEWVKIEDGKCNLGEPPDQLVEKKVEEWNLPPKIETRWEHSEWKLVIHERTAMAEAV